jgi:hypothetical protein
MILMLSMLIGQCQAICGDCILDLATGETCDDCNTANNDG